MTALNAFADLPQWVACRNEMRHGALTKVPYCAVDQKAKTDDPATWKLLDGVEALGRTMIKGHGVGVGISVLGACGGTWLGSVDLDNCRDAPTTIVELILLRSLVRETIEAHLPIKQLRILQVAEASERQVLQNIVASLRRTAS